MGLLIQPDLTLDCGRAWLPKTIREFLADVARIDDLSERIFKLEDYVHRLQDEMNKIDPFRKELSLTMLLLADVISTVKEELLQCQRSKPDPVLEEFIPLKTDDEKNDRFGKSNENGDVNSKDKMNWMSSVQLWSSDTDHLTNSKISPKKPDNKKRKEETVSHSALKGPVMVIGKEELPAGLSLGMPEEKMHYYSSSSYGLIRSPASNSVQRKQRRCWSPELHRRFVNALQQLGGPQAATPKQIRELMQVDGLTNDEVKSHLQKYRLHTRKLPPTTNSELVGGGGVWMSRESSKPTQDTTTLGPPRGNSTSAGDSGVEDEDDDHDKSESRLSGNLGEF